MRPSLLALLLAAAAPSWAGPGDCPQPGVVGAFVNSHTARQAEADARKWVREILDCGRRPSLIDGEFSYQPAADAAADLQKSYKHFASGAYKYDDAPNIQAVAKSSELIDKLNVFFGELGQMKANKLGALLGAAELDSLKAQLRDVATEAAGAPGAQALEKAYFPEFDDGQIEKMAGHKGVARMLKAEQASGDYSQRATVLGSQIEEHFKVGAGVNDSKAALVRLDQSYTNAQNQAQKQWQDAISRMQNQYSRESLNGNVPPPGGGGSQPSALCRYSFGYFGCN